MVLEILKHLEKVEANHIVLGEREIVPEMVSASSKKGSP
jgi:hypothetical protein